MQNTAKEHSDLLVQLIEKVQVAIEDSVSEAYVAGWEAADLARKALVKELTEDVSDMPYNNGPVETVFAGTTDNWPTQEELLTNRVPKIQPEYCHPESKHVAKEPNILTGTEILLTTLRHCAHTCDDLIGIPADEKYQHVYAESSLQSDLILNQITLNLEELRVLADYIYDRLARIKEHLVGEH